MSFSKPFPAEPLPERARSDGAAASPPPAARAEGIDLVGLLRILRARWFVVLACLALFVGAAVAYAVLTPKVWRASARVLLDPRDKQLVGDDVARPTQGIDPGWVATRLELVKSWDTLAEVVKRENLVDDPLVYGPAARAGSTEDPVDGAVRALAEMVLVERPKENDLIDVTVSAKSAGEAARLANAVARAFVDGLVRAKVEQIEHANALLSRQVEEMRSKMLAAEERVEAYKREHGIAVTRGNLVQEETLRQSNDALVAARTRMQEARERSERLSRALAAGDPTILSQTDPVGSAVISRLKIEAAMADRRKADLEQTLGPRHPRVAAAAAEAARARAQILDEVKALAATADLDYQVARANEENARKAVERAQANLADVSQAAVGLQELQNEANARRELYKSFVTRMEETTLQRNTQVSDGRIVSPAQVPMKPFSPRGRLALVLALVAGLGSGVSLALWRGRPLPRDEEPRPAATAAPAPAEAAAEPSPAAAPPVVSTTDPAVAAVETPDVVPPPATTDGPVAADRVPLAAASLDESPDGDDVCEVPLPAIAFAPEDDDDRTGADLEAVDATETAAAASATEIEPLPAPAAEPDVVADGAEPWSDGDPVAAIVSPISPAVAAAAPEAVAGEPTASRERIFHTVTLPLSLDRIACLGERSGPGTGARALVEGVDGRPDGEQIATLGRLLDGLGSPGGVRIVFSNTVPSVLTAALALGFARAATSDGTRAALVDLAHEEEALDPVFAAARPEELDGRALAETWERVVDGDLLLRRPLDPVLFGDPGGHPADLAEVVSDLAGEVRTVVMHLGRQPTAALLFDAADGADHVTLVIDEKDRASRRVRDEIEVTKSLLPLFDGLVVLENEEEAGRATSDEAVPGRAERSGT